MNKILREFIISEIKDVASMRSSCDTESMEYSYYTGQINMLNKLERRIKEIESIGSFVLFKDKNHDHYWIQDGLLCETYKVRKGIRYRELHSVDYVNVDRLDEQDIKSVTLLIAKNLKDN
jgi:hypothetical protein